MRYDGKSGSKFHIMYVLLMILSILLVCFVISADFTSSFANSINYVFSYNEKTTTGSNCQANCLRKWNQNMTIQTSPSVCDHFCGSLPLWPKPTNIRVTHKDISIFSKSRIVFKFNSSQEIVKDLKESSRIFMKNLHNVSNNDYWLNNEHIELFRIYINVSSPTNVLSISTNESYYLSVKKNNNNIDVNIEAFTYFGARHGLETLSQLIWFDTNTQKFYIIHDIDIKDKPEFAHRGLMVDAARNYFCIDQLKKVLDGMAATKLNVFHLHLTDASSFPIVLPRNRLFAQYGAYSPEMVYTPEYIKDLIEYARLRGIRVILEIDGPSHVPQSMNKAVDDLVICGEDPIFNGHLNPRNNKTFQVLKEIYEDLLDLGTDKEMFHIGGDEVNLTCWNQTSEWPVWTSFTNKMFDSLVVANNNNIPKYIVIWSSDLTDNYLTSLKYRNNLVVQYWYGSIESILDNGNKIILSTVGHLYLDCGFGSWKTTNDYDIGVCDPYTTWQTFYKFRPWESTLSKYKKQILGGEACLWSEQVGEDSLETRIWPRTAALAERLWSDLDEFERGDVYTRLDIHRQRLKSRGIKSEAIWPRWCSQNPGRC